MRKWLLAVSYWLLALIFILFMPRYGMKVWVKVY
jgi:hypothetical protein